MSQRCIWRKKKSKRKWGKEIAARPVRGRAHQRLSASLPPPATRDEQGGEKKNDLLALPTGRNEPGTRHSQKTYTFSECRVLTEEIQFSRGEHFLFRCQSDEKVALPEKIKKRREGQMWVRFSVSPSAPRMPLRHPWEHARTSGKNCQWDWCGTQSDKKWISLPRYKHKWPAPRCVCLDPLSSPQYLRLPHSLHTVGAKSNTANTPPDCADSVFGTPV